MQHLGYATNYIQCWAAIIILGVFQIIIPNTIIVELELKHALDVLFASYDIFIRKTRI